MSSSASSNPENRAMSSVFIYDIPYDVTEEVLKILFSEIGQVLNFRLIVDKSAKKSNIAFCEFKDPELALRAIHSLNGYELKGQAMHVDLATSEKCRQELERLQGNTTESSAEICSADKAPEEISKAVASLPAEQMFELMKQMKMCIENNPQEARNLLLQNPQLAYALLQAQVIMRIVDPTVAIKILSRPLAQDLNPEDKSEPMAVSMSEIPSSSPSYSTGIPSASSEPMTTNVPVSYQDFGKVPGVVSESGAGIMPGVLSGAMLGQVPGIMPIPGAVQGALFSGMPGPQNVPRLPNQFADSDLRALGDQDLRNLPNIDHDRRGSSAMVIDRDIRQPMGDQDFRNLGVPTTSPDNRPFDPRFRNMQGPDRNAIPGLERSKTIDPRTVHDPRNPGVPPRVEDPRKANMAASINSRLSAAGPALQSLGSNPNQPPTGPGGVLTEEQEKAALIMQVLQLTDQQIAALPPEQRQSILILKEQLIRSQMLTS